MGRQALLFAILLLLPLALAPSAQACVGTLGVPCGRIYPIITIKIEGDATMWNLTTGVPVAVDAILTYSFDMTNEGYTAAAPNEPVQIRFEYPRKPDWADLKVEPEVIAVDVNNPTFIQPEVGEPTQPQAKYSFSIPITITMTLTGQAVLKDGYDFAKLLVFAKSTESGLYQSGYGIKEMRVVPENALHESDVAGQQDVFTASALPAIGLTSVERSFGGTTVTFAPPATPAFWEPAEFVATVSPAPTGRMVLALHDEAGALVASTLPVDSSSGEVGLLATLVQPGRHTATLTLLPAAGTMTPPLTFPLEFDVGDLSAEGYVYPKTYLVQANEPLPRPLVSTADPLAQFERDIPFFLFESAQSVSATVTLVTAAPIDLGRSLANLQFSLHDPDGNTLSAGSVDPTKPAASVRVGSVAQDGWYVLRLKGLGAPGAASYDARIEVNYAAAHEARNRADGIPDITGGLLARAGANLSLPTDLVKVWESSDITPVLDAAQGLGYTLTVFDVNGTLAYASGQRTGASAFSAPAPGTYRAYAFIEPTQGALPFSPTVRAFTFDVGRGNTTIARTFEIEDAFEAPFAPMPSLLGYHALRVYEGAAPPVLEGGELVDEEGNAADASTAGIYFVRVTGQGAPPQGSAVSLVLTQEYAAPVTLVGPAAPSTDQKGGLPVPGLAIAFVLAAIGAVAVVVAIRRR